MNLNYKYQISIEQYYKSKLPHTMSYCVTIVNVTTKQLDENKLLLTRYY